jgi:putative endonuclease
MLHRYFIYILTNKNKTTFYTGVTNNLSRRLEQHHNDALDNKRSFTGLYKCIYLLHFEEYQNIHHAIAREKEIKGWSREKKIDLIKATNPELAFLNNDGII